MTNSGSNAEANEAKVENSDDLKSKSIDSKILPFERHAALNVEHGSTIDSSEQHVRQHDMEVHVKDMLGKELVTVEVSSVDGSARVVSSLHESAESEGDVKQEHKPEEKAQPSNNRSKLMEPSVNASSAIKTVFFFIADILGTLFAATWWIVVTFVTFIWNHPTQALFNALLLATLALVIVTGSQIHDHMILGRISSQTVDEIISASSFKREFNSLGMRRRGLDEFLNVGGPDWAMREGVRAVLFHARKADLSIEHQAVLLAVVEVESGFNPMAHAQITSACGLFQFIRETGQRYGVSQEECMNPWINAQAGIRHYVDNYERTVAPRVKDLAGPEKLFKTFELSYYLHHDGPASSNPSKDVKAVVLSGTQFLLRVHSFLDKEDQSRQHAPTFTERFEENLWSMLDKLRSIFGRSQGRALSFDESELARGQSKIRVLEYSDQISPLS